MILQNYAAEHIGDIGKRAQEYIASRIDAGAFRPIDSALAGVLPARNAARLTIREVLACE
jgi:hypothetical protein